MKLGKTIKTIMKVAPIVYPIVKKAMDNRKASRAGVKLNGRDY
ncbi:MAG TPA: hypothetical protein VNQ57_11410 [Ureibacillus sp.]|nr:hypothetical protein [Ureibacillus sp.]